MMSKLFLSMMILTLLVTLEVQAKPVLLELFTSEGCRSCPEGERVIEKLNNRSDFFALSFHVDYWDRLGWQDKFAQKAFTNRQKKYAVNFNNKSLFTPQVVLNGKDETVASWAWRVKMLAAGMRKNQVDIPIHYYMEDNREFVKIPSYNLKKEADIWYVTYLPKVKGKIASGENAGREGYYVNVVRSIEKLKVYKGEAIEVELPLKPQGLQVAVFLQEQNLGDVLGLYHP